MGRFRKIWLWGGVLVPLIVLCGAPFVFKVWLKERLNRDWILGETRFHLVNPHLGWRFNFTVDTLQVSSPKFTLNAPGLNMDIRLWQSLVSLRPSMEIRSQSVLVNLPTDSTPEGEGDLRQTNHKPLAFPKLRIPLPFHAKTDFLAVTRAGSAWVHVLGLQVYSQGPKGAAVEADSLLIGWEEGQHKSTSSFGMRGSYRISARWFGKSVKYQFKIQNKNGDYFKGEGNHRKTDLVLGQDSAECSIANLSQYAGLLPTTPLPMIEDIHVQVKIARDKNLKARARLQLTTPPLYAVGTQHLSGDVELTDSTGSLEATAKGKSGQNAQLQGHFEYPSPSTLQGPSQSNLGKWVQGFTAALSGFSRGVQLNIGDRILPGDMEIRTLNISPGLHAEADIRTKDGSTLQLSFAPGSIFPGGPASAANRIFQDSLNPWTITFTGQIDPKESWAHAWTDTNISFEAARIRGQFRKDGLEAEAWVTHARAYGSAADSLYTKQLIQRNGYSLLASQLYWKDVVWPISGYVDWGKTKSKVNQARHVSLEFHTHHNQFGTISYAMPRMKCMEVKADKVVVDKLPYTRIGKLMTLQPVVSGTFVWDWGASTGATDIRSAILYNGTSLDVHTQGAWDPQRYSLQRGEIFFAGSRIGLSGDFRLHGRQFYQLKSFDFKDVAGLTLETDHFDASRLAVFLGSRYPVQEGQLNGRIAYTDTSGFLGSFSAENVELKPLRNLFHIQRATLSGEGENLLLSVHTLAAPESPWFRDSLSLRVGDILGKSKTLSLRASSENGLKVKFEGRSQEFRDLEGRFLVDGTASLPGQGGVIQNLNLQGHISMPFTKEIGSRLAVDSGFFQGQYAVPGLDTQSISGSLSVGGGNLQIPDLTARDSRNVTLTGNVIGNLNRPFKLTAHLVGENLKLKLPDLKKLVLENADVSIQLDSLGFFADGKIGKAEFQSLRAPINLQGVLENLILSYHLPPAARKGSAGPAPIPQLKIKTDLRNFLFQHKVGFREVQHFFRNVKVDKRKQRVKPIDVEISVETAGSGNRIETDILRMNFKGDLQVHGVYPYTLLTGQFSALSGELGQSNQSYDITDFDLKWQSATVEEGRISLEGGKRLRYDCKPDTRRTCNVYIKLDGRLDEMAFTYDSDCGGNSGNVIEPAALINSVSRGCYSEQFVAGAGGGNYGEAVVNFLEPAINEKLSSVGNRYSLGWIKSTQVSGIGTVMSGDSTGSEPISIGIESKEKWGMSLKAKAGYHPEKKLPNPWENKVALEWRPPLEKVAHSSTWKRRVRDRVMLEASAENRPEENFGETEKNQVRKQIGISYHYKFWDLW